MMGQEHDGSENRGLLGTPEHWSRHDAKGIIHRILNRRRATGPLILYARVTSRKTGETAVRGLAMQSFDRRPAMRAE